jgi:hypothetical protein
MNYYVYWYRLKEHKNCKTEGYIGITKNITRRHSTHLYCARNNKTNLHFHNAISKYGESNIILEILQVCTSKDEARMLEEYYRPHENIGWNMATGGVLPVNTNKTPISLYHKDNYVVLHKFTNIVEASEALGLSYKRLTQANSRKQTIYGYDGWAVLFNNDYDRSKTPDCLKLIANRVSEYNKGKPSKYKGTTNRWTEEEKLKIGSYHKGKKIPIEQILALKKHNQMHSPKCRSITLVHKDSPTKLHKFHSISEASRKLDIPLSRLKSKALRPLNTYGKDGWAIQSLGSE